MSQSSSEGGIARRIAWILVAPVVLTALLVGVSVRSAERQELVRSCGAHLQGIAHGLATDTAGEAHEALALELAAGPVARDWSRAPSAARHWHQRLAQLVAEDPGVDLVGTLRWRADHVDQVARSPERRSNEALCWVLSSEAQPSFTMREAYQPDMAIALFSNRAGRSELLPKCGERWIQGYAPVRSADGRVAALFVAGHEASDQLLAIDLRAAGLGASVLALMGLACCVVIALVRQLERDRASQTAAAEVCGELLSNAQLQVREPLDGILGMADLLLDGPLSPEEKAGVEVVRSQGHALRDVMQNIVDYADLESGRELPFNPRPVDLLALCDRIITRYGFAALQRRVELNVNFPPELGREVVMDGVRLEQILGSVIGNALRHTQRGEVALEVSRVVDAPSDLRFEVRDTGRGIPEERWERLFESFQSLEGAPERRLSSPELGLDVARRVVECFGGRFELASIPGHGSRIAVTLAAEGLALAAQEPIWGRALVVDDQPLARTCLRAHLRSLGLCVIEAYDRESALAVLALSRGNPFQLIVMAQELPDGDATGVAEVLRRDPGARGVPVIVLVAGAVRETRIQTAPGGPLGVLTKPVQRDGLAELVYGLVPEPPSSRPVTHGSAVRAEGSHRILLGRTSVIDDAVEVRLLEAAGHHVDVVESGIELVQRFRQGRFDIVLLDVLMNGLDGYSVTRSLREIERETGHRTPVLGLTSQMLAGDRERALACGMDDYLVRPVGRSHLLAAVAQWAGESEPVVPSPRSPDRTPAPV